MYKEAELGRVSVCPGQQDALQSNPMALVLHIGDICSWTLGPGCRGYPWAITGDISFDF